MKRVVATIMVLAIAGGCSTATTSADVAGRDVEQEVESAPTAKPSNVRYESVFDIRSVLEAEGMSCGRWAVTPNPGPDVVERAVCTEWLIFSIHANASAAQREFQDLADFLEPFGIPLVFIVGPNWAANCGERVDECAELQDVLGGEVVYSAP